MGCVGIGVTAERTLADACAGELVRGFPQRGYLLFGELRHEDLRRVGGEPTVSAGVRDGRHSVGELQAVDTQTLTERHGIKTVTHLLHDKRDFVDRLVEDEQFAVAVVDQSA